MLEYLGFLSEPLYQRALAVCREYRRNHELDAKNITYQDRLKTFEDALPKEIENIYWNCVELRGELETAKNAAVYEAGFFDGITIGAMAASRK